MKKRVSRVEKMNMRYASYNAHIDIVDCTAHDAKSVLFLKSGSSGSLIEIFRFYILTKFLYVPLNFLFRIRTFFGGELEQHPSFYRT